MDTIIWLFWVGLIVTLATMVFGIFMSGFFVIIAGVFGVVGWMWEKLTGKE